MSPLQKTQNLKPLETFYIRSGGNGDRDSESKEKIDFKNSDKAPTNKIYRQVSNAYERDLVTNQNV